MKKIVTILVALALIAMIGTAAADQVNVYEPGTNAEVTSISLAPGGAAVSKDLVVSGFIQPAGTGHNLTYVIAVSVNPGGAVPADIIVNFKELTTVAKPWGPATYAWTQDAAIGGAELLGIRFSAVAGAPVGAKYEILVSDHATGNNWPATLNIVAVAIPEFPTIALPVAAILGLAFIFQRRREED